MITNKWMPPRHPWMSVSEAPSQGIMPLMSHSQDQANHIPDTIHPHSVNQSQNQMSTQEANHSEHTPLSLHWSDPLANAKTWSTVSGK